MFKTLKIAVLEISILFYSPVAWLILTIFIIQNGLGFFGMLDGFQEALSMGIDVNNLTFSLFPDTGGLFNNVLETLYLYIPLLTMGLMSRETSSGSIKLLLSSPVKIRQIILGKYIAIIAYGSILVIVLALYAIIGITIIKDADVTLILSGLLGIFLLICTYAAIGLFMSSLTSLQIVAAISTLTIFAILRYVGSVGQSIDFLRDITYFLSISGRTDDMLKGLITSRDVLYFIIIITLFLSLCIFRLQSNRESKHWSIQTAKYVVIVCTALLLGYVSSRPSFIFYKDMTATQSRTLTKNSQLITSKLDGELEITTYVNLLDENVYSGLPVSRNIDKSLFDEYQRYIPNLKMNYVYYYDVTNLKDNRNMVYQGDLTGLSTKQIAERVADNMGLDLSMFISPTEIRKQIDLRSENNSFVRILKHKGKTSRLRIYNDMERIPSEAEITAAIKQLLVPVPKVAFVTGNNERSIRKKGNRNFQLISDMQKNRNALINQGFNVISINLNNQEIPDSLSVLVLGDPTIALSKSEQQKLETYIDHGGNMMILAEPERASILTPLLHHIGISLKKGMLLNPSKDDTPDNVYGQFTGRANLIDSVFTKLEMRQASIAMPTSAALEYTDATNFHIDTLLVSPNTGWNTLQPVDLTLTDPKYNSSLGNEKGSFPITLLLHRYSTKQQNQKILVSGDADFMSNSQLSKNARGANEQFTMSLFKWFSNGAFPIDVSRKRITDDAILIKRKQIDTIKLLCLGVFPSLIIALSAFVLIRRKRY